MKIKINKLIYSIILGMIGFSLIFIAGNFSNNSYVENVPSYAAEVATKKTNKGNLCAITVGTTKESGTLPQADVEFYNLYGIFKQEKITFASTINSNKKDHDIRIENNLSDNLSMMYMGPFGTISYKGHYKHYVWPIEMMFPDSRDGYDVSSFLANISQSQADKILDSKGEQRNQDGEFSYNQYLTLRYQPLNFVIDGNAPIKFVINNIYYETNYYYEGLNEIMGEFIMVSYYLPFNLRGGQKSTYFMSKYPYQNEYFMNYINSTFGNKKYQLKVNDYNLKESIDEETLLSFYYGYKTSELHWVSIFLLTFSCLLIFISLMLFTFYSKNKKILHLMFLFAFLIPYIIFFVINKITNSVFWFSRLSCSVYTWSLFIYLIIVSCYCLIQHFNKRENKNDELNI